MFSLFVFNQTHTQTQTHTAPRSRRVIFGYTTDYKSSVKRKRQSGPVFKRDKKKKKIQLVYNTQITVHTHTHTHALTNTCVYKHILCAGECVFLAPFAAATIIILRIRTHTHTHFFVWKSRHWCYTQFYKFIIFTPFTHVDRPAASAVRSSFPPVNRHVGGGLRVLKKGFVPAAAAAAVQSRYVLDV